MKILILENDQYLVESKTVPIVGRHYSLEDATHGSNAQNSAFHALISEFYRWMLSSNEFVYEIDSITYDFSCPDWLTLKDIFKRKYGAGFESFVFVEMHEPVMGAEFITKPKIMDAKKYSDIPEAIRKDPDYKSLIRGRLKSWACYTKKQRMNLLDNTINIMKLSKCDSKKFHEILDGLEEVKS
ncbi:MAG: hypothetical protein PF693_09920 [Spirochaetia bacterium]|jgi:hypothetical protein|nr:hypothetical protein [Spirochaetia bacterium]